jgi:putative ABC transport system substrate-binding protein
MRAVVPRLTHVVFLTNGDNQGCAQQFTEIAGVGAVLGLQVSELDVRSVEQIEPAIRFAKAAHADALLVQNSSPLVVDRKRLAELAAQNSLPAIYYDRVFVDAGGLMSYGPSGPGSQRRVAAYVDKILKGAEPADLPVEQPTSFDLVINQAAVERLGLTIPQDVALQVTEWVQ